MALLPLARAGMLVSEIHVNAITGSTGAGQKPVSTTHFSWRNDNVSIYKAFEHQHLAEIRESLVQLQSNFNQEISFIPVRGDFARGIFAWTYIEFFPDIDYAKSLYYKFYEAEPFVCISDKEIDLKQVVGTNKFLLHLEKHGNKLLITSVIDNLLKGASGQAVQNMNIMCGLRETTGLKLKSIGF